MQWIDWIAVCVPLVLVTAIAAYTGRFLKSVADYMAGGRCAGRYMLCVARGEMGAGAAVFVAMFEIFSKAGVTYLWWNWISMLTFLLVAITGFVVYRFRETRALTLAQFFEMRYSRRFRIFAGGLGFVAGIMNFGIIPAIGARFFVYFLGLPQKLLLGGIEIPTYVVLMAVLLAITVYLTVSGGQITVMITDCASGLMDQWMFLVVIAAMLCMFSWSQISTSLLDCPPGQSLMNPFDSLRLQDFNLWYVLMSVFVAVYGTMAWQNASAYNSAARTPHESRMGNVLGRWREFSKLLTMTVLALGAVTFMKHQDFAAQSSGIQGILDQIGNPQIREQMRVPTALSILLPAGIKGILCAIVLTGIFGGDTTHLHSWGSMFVQDIILPLRKKPLSPQQHIRALRLAMLGVAVFAFLFGTFFSQTEYVAMWFRITMAIYIGGAGSVIIGGLYWKRGTTAGAWAAMLVGSGLSVGGIIVRQMVPGFPLNGMEISFYSTLLAIGIYVAVSLLTGRKSFNLDRMLHRGEYAVKTDQTDVAVTQSAKGFRWSKLIGIDEKFSRSDRWISGSVFLWSVFWVVVLIVGCIWNAIQPWSNHVWSVFWWWSAIMIPLAISVGTTVWFTIGVLKDLRRFFTALQKERVDDADDGTVVQLSE
ncbi:MAG: sodium:solute symporter [Kiritimatiellales bacterium]